MIAHGKIVDTITDGDHDSRAFVTQHQRQRILNGAVGGRQVAVTDAASGDANRHLAVLWIGHVDLFYQDRLADFARQNCFRQLSHECSISLKISRARERSIALQMRIAVAEHQLSRGEAFEPVADDEFIGHAHAAVQLHGLLGDEAA
jgi:hypothetical protein